MSNFYTHLGVLDQTWLDCREIVVYGLGVMALKSMESLRRDFEIPFIIDNDPKKAGTHYAGIPILTHMASAARLQKRWMQLDFGKHWITARWIYSPRNGIGTTGARYTLSRCTRRLRSSARLTAKTATCLCRISKVRAICLCAS